MTATLQERLNYLINYSSQLIFVSGDTLADQSQALESFLFQQGENTELAYITADDSFETTDYRRLLCQQLLGEAGSQFSRPLNECLASLNQREGPIMVAITHAHKMPNDVLQELWELVLQSRFAGNKQHLNVVLFADKAWASQAKKWLPANNSGTPLLLSSQRTSFTPDPTANTLQRRPIPSQKHVPSNKIEQRPILSMGAFWAAAALVFIGVFSGLLIWLYGASMSALFSPLSEPEPVVAAPPINTVVQWQNTLVAKTDEPTTNTAPAPKQELTLTTNRIASVGNESIDEPLDKPSSEPTRDSLDTPANAPQIISENTLENSAVTMPRQAETSAEQALAISGNYVIQIAGLKDADLLQRFLNDNNLADLTQTYSTIRYGGPWYVVIMKGSYLEIDAAKRAISNLPMFQGREQAFVKSVAAVRKELSEGTPKDTLPLQQ